MNIKRRFSFLTDELAWKARDCKIKLLQHIMKHQPVNTNVFTPIFYWIEDTHFKLLGDEIEEMGRDIVEMIADEFIAHAETAAMGDASFQEWLKVEFPNWTPSMREHALDLYRSGRIPA